MIEGEDRLGWNGWNRYWISEANKASEGNALKSLTWAGKTGYTSTVMFEDEP